MRNVTRPHEPEVLITHGEHWKADLLNELEKGDQADKKRIKTIQNKYSHKDIKAALKKMYKYCCYCESRVNHVTVEHIEHRKPKAKDKFPEYTFEWGNLHLSCPNCNKEKGDKWNTNHPILDAEHDIPISRFLSYRRCERTYVNQRGKTTRDII